MTDEPTAGPTGWRDRPALTDTDLTDFLALRHVCGRPECTVGKVADTYVEAERPRLPCLADSLDALIDAGHVTLGEPEPQSCGIRRVTVTASGRARYEELCDRQGIPPYPHIIDGTPGQ